MQHQPPPWFAASRALLAAAALLAGVAAGCAPDDAASAGAAALHFDPCQSLVLAPDAAATPAQLEGIAAGMALWNRVAAARLMMASDAPAAPAEAAPAVPVHFQRAAAPFHGLYDDVTGQVFINQDLADDARAQAITIAHEIGHAFGLAHVPADRRASLMNPGNLDVEPTDGDVAELAARWGRCVPPAAAAATPR